MKKWKIIMIMVLIVIGIGMMMFVMVPDNITYPEIIDYTIHTNLTPLSILPSVRMEQVPVYENEELVFEGVYSGGILFWLNGEDSKILFVELDDVPNDSVVKINGIIKQFAKPPKGTKLIVLDYEVIHEKQEIIEKLNQASYICNEIEKHVNENNNFSVSMDNCPFSEEDDLGNTYRWLPLQSKFVWFLSAFNEIKEGQDPSCVGGVYGEVVFDMEKNDVTEVQLHEIEERC